MNIKIRLLITGGTIDKEYDPLAGALVSPKTHLLKMLRQGRCKADVTAEVVMLKDSLEMNEGDRGKILKKCQSCPEDKIVITHGTDTMAETARTLGDNLKGKTIVLTGAMVPGTISNSDALFNLGGAIAAVQILPAGVYVSMNGKIFPWDNVQKNKKLGEFEKIK